MRRQEVNAGKKVKSLLCFVLNPLSSTAFGWKFNMMLSLYVKSQVMKYIFYA